MKRKEKNIIEHLWRRNTKKNEVEIKNILCVYTQLSVETGYRFEEEKLKIGQTKNYKFVIGS